MIRRCKTCNRLTVLEDDEHRCPPAWTAAEASVATDPDEQIKVYADDAKSAARKFAERWWSEEGPADGESIDVAVFVDGHPQIFTVTATWSVTMNVTTRGER